MFWRNKTELIIKNKQTRHIYKQHFGSKTCLHRIASVISPMVSKYNITFHVINKSEMDTQVNFEESLDPYSAFRKASQDSTVPDQPLWGLLVWQVVAIFLLGLVFVCECCYYKDVTNSVTSK